jgi:hypothetical protein
LFNNFFVLGTPLEQFFFGDVEGNLVFGQGAFFVGFRGFFFYFLEVEILLYFCPDFY